MRIHAVTMRMLAMAAALLGSASNVCGASLTVSVRDQQAAPLVDAVVSMTPVSGGLGTSGKTASIDQRGLEFIPRVLAIQSGTAVSFPNSDQVRHHVYSFSPVRPFELRLYKDTPAEPVVFDRPGIATLGCNIHDWMIAYVVVVETPYFAVTDDQGRATIAVPEGEYDFRAWHARADETIAQSAERITIGPAGAKRDIVRAVRAADPPRMPSELELKFRRHQKKHDGDAPL